MSDNDETEATLYVRVRTTRPDALSPRLRNALDELAAALADEEVQLSGEMAEALAADSEVSGYAMGSSLRFGDIAGSLRSNDLGWCLFYGSKDGGSCGVFGEEPGTPLPDNCGVHFA